VRRRLQRTTAMMLAALAFAAGPIGRPDGIVGGVPSVSAAAFSDVGGHWAADAVEWAAANGIVDGYPDGTFRPDGAVSEPEFLAMLLRAFPQTVAPEPAPGEPWYAGFYVVARAYGWPVAGDPDAPFDRGRVARIVAASQGVAGSEEEAIRYLLANGLAHGKTSPTVEGFAPRDRLTRAEAVTFIRRLTERGLYLQPAPTDGQPGAASADIRVFGYAIGDREQDVVAGLGEPARRDASLYGFDWYVYNRDDRRYGLIGVQSGRVVALFGIIDAWEAEGGIRFGSTYDEVRNVYGEPLEFIEKGNARYLFEYGEREALLYETEKGYATFFFDRRDGDRAVALLAVEREVEQSLRGFYGEPSERLRQSLELESFELANASRAAYGLRPFTWDESAAAVARKHSCDMAQNGYFDHVAPDGRTLADRLKAGGVRYRLAAENLAAGTPDAFRAHVGLMNSPGHRQNLLHPSLERLGVGVCFGGEMNVYLTQNFYAL